MVKKEFTSKATLELSEKSDVELIEMLENGLTDPKRDAVNALLDIRLKKVMNYLIEVTKGSARATTFHNWILILLTAVITFLTIVLVIQGV